MKFKRHKLLTRTHQLLRFFLLVILIAVFIFPQNESSAVTGLTYYVSPSGADSNPGSQTLPWKTINKAANIAVAGDTVYVRGGVYYEAITFSKSGTQTNPIKFLAFENETPVIDGDYSLPGYGSYLIDIRGNYVTVSGFEVRNSEYGGIFVYGDYDVVDNVFVHHNMNPGIIISHGKYSVVEDSRIWRNSIINENGSASVGATGVSAARLGVSYATIRNNEVWENWGEGISTFEATQITIEGNVSHDNYNANIYISDSTYVLCQQNLVYMDPSSYVYGLGSNVGIMMGDEKVSPASANIKIINNIAYGNHRNYHWWKGEGIGMNNVLIANNTFVNGTGNASGGEGNVLISKGTHVNSRFVNNLVSQDSSLPVIATIAQAGITYSNNLWSKTPYAAASGSGDVIGDPLLAKTENQFSPEWYRLTSGSPAIDKGKSLSEVTVDYFGNARVNSPDIGAVEGEDTKPVLSFVSPNHKFSGGSIFTLFAYGSRYTPTSVIRWNGSDRPTTFVSTSKLAASISAADIASAGSASVAVYNPETGGGLSRTLTVTISISVPSVIAISPDAKAAGSPGFYLVVYGKNFLPGATVRWNGSNRSTTFVSNSKLVSLISSADVASVGTSSITVINPTSGDAISNPVVFSIK